MSWCDALMKALGLQRSYISVRVRERLTDIQQPSVTPLRSPTTSPRTSSPQRVQVQRDRRALRDIRGWRRRGDRLLGAYRTRRGSCAGEILIADPRRPQFVIVNPPRALLEGSHAACFRRRGKGKYLVHFGIESPEVDSGVVAIEMLLAQAFSSART